MEAIDWAASLGIRNLEAFFDQDVSKDIHDKFDFRLEDKILYKIREKLIEKGIHMTNYYIHDFPSDEVACRQLFDFGKKMGIVTFVSEPDPQDLDLIEKYCKEYDIRLAIHNHGVDLSPDYWQPEKVLEAVEGRSDYVGACGDMGYWIRSGIDPVKAIELLDDRLFVLHMHDLHEMNENGHDVPWGEGKADLAGTLGLLKSIDHEGLFISLEYAHNFGKSLPQIEKSIEYFHGLMIRMEED
jgi:sugar phosphate isomerase/epimerase